MLIAATLAVAIAAAPTQGFEHQELRYDYEIVQNENGTTTYKGVREDGVRFELTKDRKGRVEGKIGKKKVSYRARED